MLALAAACRLSLVAASGGDSLVLLQGPLTAVAPLVASTGLGPWASAIAARRLSSCGTKAWSLGGMWNPPGPGLEPVSPALAGGFFSTGPSGKSRCTV